MRIDEACKVLDLPQRGKKTSQEIKTAYKKACLKHHPDKNIGDPDATARFQAVGEAFKTLDAHINAEGGGGGRASSSGSSTGGGGSRRERAESNDSDNDDDNCGCDDDENEDGSFSFKDMFSQHFGSSPNGDVDPEMAAFAEDLFRRAENWDRRSYFKNRKIFKSPQALFEAAKHNIALKRQREVEQKREEKRFEEEQASRKRAEDEDRDCFEMWDIDQLRKTALRSGINIRGAKTKDALVQLLCANEEKRKAKEVEAQRKRERASEEACRRSEKKNAAARASAPQPGGKKKKIAKSIPTPVPKQTSEDPATVPAESSSVQSKQTQPDCESDVRFSKFSKLMCGDVILGVICQISIGFPMSFGLIALNFTPLSSLLTLGFDVLYFSSVADGLFGKDAFTVNLTVIYFSYLQLLITNIALSKAFFDFDSATFGLWFEALLNAIVLPLAVSRSFNLESGIKPSSCDDGKSNPATTPRTAPATVPTESSSVQSKQTQSEYESNVRLSKVSKIMHWVMCGDVILTVICQISIGYPISFGLVALNFTPWSSLLALGFNVLCFFSDSLFGNDAFTVNLAVIYFSYLQLLLSYLALSTASFDLDSTTTFEFRVEALMHATILALAVWRRFKLESGIKPSSCDDEEKAVQVQKEASQKKKTLITRPVGKEPG